MNIKRKGLLILLAFLILGIVGCADESSSDNTDLIIDDGNTSDDTSSSSDTDKILEYQMWYLKIIRNHLNYVLGNSDLDDTTTWNEGIGYVLPKDYPALDYPISVSSVSDIIVTDIATYSLYVDYYGVIIGGLTEEQIENIFNTLQ